MSQFKHTMRKVLIINGSPNNKSFCHALQQSYKKGSLKNNNEVRETTLSEMEFNPILKYGYTKRMELEPDLLVALDNIKWADHIVWIYPNWWGSMPALMKGFVERVFLPRITFEYLKTSPRPKPLLVGKTCEIICTMNTPVWYYKYIQKDVGGRMLRVNLCDCCGIKNKRTTYMADMRQFTPEKRNEWLEKIERLASK
ncbi:hypothetical protein BB559_007436 [Furculomyces boomerangus]|uniref:Flavodoxin-like fold domain-containing protein n=2 Tax=Harpellales TaxID=61421 RepID=A0A2T9XXF0_9FUNG|nr:hypothetical protein BB559_007436 [Furculomyces boomerangus]PVZ96580.1 hypothetical protein BB558_007501 [Smittium angustum]